MQRDMLPRPTALPAAVIAVAEQKVRCCWRRAFASSRTAVPSAVQLKGWRHHLGNAWMRLAHLCCWSLFLPSGAPDFFPLLIRGLLLPFLSFVGSVLIIRIGLFTAARKLPHPTVKLLSVLRLANLLLVSCGGASAAPAAVAAGCSGCVRLPSIRCCCGVASAQFRSSQDFAGLAHLGQGACRRALAGRLWLAFSLGRPRPKGARGSACGRQHWLAEFGPAVDDAVASKEALAGRKCLISSVFRFSRMASR